MIPALEMGEKLRQEDHFELEANVGCIMRVLGQPRLQSVTLPQENKKGNNNTKSHRNTQDVSNPQQSGYRPAPVAVTVTSLSLSAFG